MTTAVMLDRRSEVRLGLRANGAQFSLLVIVNAFVGAMAGLERSILPAIAIALSAVGLLVTVGLFVWEHRNIQKCKWMIDSAQSVEKALAGRLQLPTECFLPFRIMKFEGYLAAEQMDRSGGSPSPNPPTRLSKTHAVYLIYGVAAAAWVIPMVGAYCGR